MLPQSPYLWVDLADFEMCVVDNGGLEQIDALEYENEIPQEAIHTVFLHIYTAQLNGSLIYVPKAQMEKG